MFSQCNTNLIGPETSRARFPILGVRRAAWGRELRLERRLAVTRSFCLGFPDFCCCEGCGDKLPCTMHVDPPPKKRKNAPEGKENAIPNKKWCLSLRKGKDKAGPAPQERFCEITMEERLAELSKGHVPANTQKNTD